MSQIKYVNELNNLTREAAGKYWKYSSKHLKRLKKRLFCSKEKKIEHIYFLLCLNHNNETLKTIGQLMNKEQLEEALVLMRVVLERSGLLLKSMIEGLSIEEIEKLRSKHCVAYLKKYFDIGRLYGFFSEIIHSTANVSLYFSILYLFKKGSMKKSSEYSEIDTLFRILYFFMMEINTALIKFICKEYFEIKSNWIMDDHKKWHYIFQGSKAISPRLVAIYDRFCAGK